MKKNERYEVGQHVVLRLAQRGEQERVGRITRPPTLDANGLGSPYFTLAMNDGSEELVTLREILRAAPDLADPASVEAWLNA